MEPLRDLKAVEEPEGARRATEGSATAAPADPPDSEVVERGKRRRFSSEYKLRILREADDCKGDGDIGALLRREGLYSSHLVNWRKQRDDGLSTRKRGRKANPSLKRIKELERENAQLRKRLKRTDLLLDIQKKASELLGIPLNSPDIEDED
jgi:transposase